MRLRLSSATGSKPRMGRRASSAAALLALLVFAVSCTDDTGTVESSPASTTPPTTTSTTPPTTTARTVPSNAEVVWVGGSEYWCEAGGWSNRCVAATYYAPQQVDFFSPDLWCEFSTCTFYNPDSYFEINFNGSNYICEAISYPYGYQNHYDCMRYLGGRVSWINPTLYCNDSWNGIACDSNDYPSVWDDYSLVTISGTRYICNDNAFGDIPCVRYWYGGSPSGYSFWSPDYYCSRFGSTCEPAY